jgi:hypothetical protein
MLPAEPLYLLFRGPAPLLLKEADAYDNEEALEI